MLEGAAVLGCIAAKANKEETECARKYAHDIGFAFQIRDDILDVIGSAKDIGKTPGKDKNGMKTTYVDVIGIEKAQKRVETLTQSAKDVLPKDKNTTFLSEFADFLCSRIK